MTCQQLFIELVQRLAKYSDAAVLWIFLKEHADVAEYKDSAERIAYDQLQQTVDRRDVQRSLGRLKQQGLISTRVHANFRTHVTVNREAVLALLRKPMAERMPSRSAKHFPFLDAWDADIAATQAAEAIESASATELPGDPQPFPDPPSP